MDVHKIAHDLNNCIAIISGNARLSLMEEKMDPQYREAFETIVRECQRAKELVGQLKSGDAPPGDR